MTIPFRPVLIYSAFGLGKTSLLELLARKVLQPGQKARLVTAEHYNTIQPAIDEGLIEVWKVNTRDHPFETLRSAVDGYWPADVNDPTSPLIAPTPEMWAKTPVRFFEGIATMCNYLAGSYSVGGLTQRGETERIGYEKEYIQFTDGMTDIAGMTWTYFRIAQSEISDLIQRSMKRGGYVVWTSHEDTVKGGRSIGPEVIGSAITGSIGREFSDVLHIVGVPTDVTDTTTGEIRRLMDRRLYLKQHYPPGSGVPATAKNSVGIARQSSVPDYLKMTTDGQPMLDVIDRLFNVWEKR